MGLCVLTRELLNGIGRYWGARRIAPDLRVRPRWADWPIFREIFGFGQLRVEHVGIVQANINAVIGAFSDCVRMPIRVGF